MWNFAHSSKLIADCHILLAMLSCFPFSRSLYYLFWPISYFQFPAAVSFLYYARSRPLVGACGTMEPKNVCHDWCTCRGISIVSPIVGELICMSSDRLDYIKMLLKLSAKKKDYIPVFTSFINLIAPA